MNASTILVIHPEVEDRDVLKLATKNSVHIVVTDNIDRLPLNAYITHIGFVYHRNDRFPFRMGREKVNYSSSQYMSESVKTQITKYLSNSQTSRTIDLLSCTLPDHAKEEMNQWALETPNLVVRYSIDPTGQPGDWIMEETTDLNQKNVDIRDLYFTDYIANWKVKLEQTPIFVNDDSSHTFANHFIHHKASKMISLNKDLEESDIVKNYYEHAYISLPNGYIFNGNGHTINLNGMDTSIVWKGLIECRAENHYVNQKNIIKNLGIISDDLNNTTMQTRLYQNAGYIVREAQTYFDVYDCYVIGNISREGGGICGSNTGSNNTDSKKTDSNDSDIKIYSCFVKADNIDEKAGGIVGANSGRYHNLKIHSCFSAPMTTGNSTIQLSAGGIVGSVENIDFDLSKNTEIDIYSCYSQLNNIVNYAGGILGEIKINSVNLATGSSYVSFKVTNCYSTAFVYGGGGGIVGRIPNDLSDNIYAGSPKIFDISGIYSRDDHSDIKKVDNLNNICIRGDDNVDELKNKTQDDLENISYGEMFGSVSSYSREYPYLKSFHELYSMPTADTLPSHTGRIIRQDYIYDNYLKPRGIAPWDMSENLYKENDKYPVFSTKKDDNNDNNALIMTPILLLDTLHQVYPKTDSSLNKYYDGDEANVNISENISDNIPQYYYGDGIVMFNDISNGKTDFSNISNASKKDFVRNAIMKYAERRLMMVRTREFLKTLNYKSDWVVTGSDEPKENKIRRQLEIDALLKVRKNNGNDYMLMDGVVGDMSRMVGSDVLANDIYANFDYTSLEDQDLVRRNVEQAYLPKTSGQSVNYMYRDIFDLKEYRQYYQENHRLNPYDESILGNSSDPNKINKDIQKFDFSANASDSHYSKKLVKEMQDLAKEIGEYIGINKDTYEYIYDDENNQAYDFSGMKHYFSREDDANKATDRRRDEIMWVIYELLKTEKFNKLVETNLTRIIPPRPIFSDDISNKPSAFTSLEESKKQKVVLNIYNEYRKMYVNPVFFFLNENADSVELDINDDNNETIGEELVVVGGGDGSGEVDESLNG